MFSRVRATAPAGSALAPPVLIATVLAATVLAATVLAAGLTACSATATQSARSGLPGARGAAATDGRGTGIGISVATAPEAARSAAGRVRCPRVSLPTEPIPAGFAPVAVVECLRVTASGPGGGVTEVKRQVAVGELTALVHALLLPSAHQKGARPACMVPASAVPWLELIGRNGKEIHPALPVGDCGLPIAPVLTSLRSLHWTTLRSASAAAPTGPLNTPSDELVTGQRPPIQSGPVHRLTPGSPVSSPAG